MSYRLHPLYVPVSLISSYIYLAREVDNSYHILEYTCKKKYLNIQEGLYYGFERIDIYFPIEKDNGTIGKFTQSRIKRK